jgi:hypothetical protein
MKKSFLHITIISLLLILNACHNVLEPQPVDLTVDKIVLNEAKDAPLVQLGLYNSFRVIPPAMVIAGDMTADNLIHNGTFTQYRELGTKRITSANGSVAILWEAIYNTIYVSNFILERLPDITGIPSAQRDQFMATAHFLRGYAYFVGVNTYGAIPLVLTTDIATNRNIPRASTDEILSLVLEDYNFALGKLPAKGENPGYASESAVRSALARFYLYQQDWANAESNATSVISSNRYTLETSFENVVNKDFPTESILEVGYTLIDDPGTDNNIGLNSLFVGRREIIPSDQVVLALSSAESGNKPDSLGRLGRFSSISFKTSNFKGSDNGWSVAKYGTPDVDNNNVYVFRLAELYLIRAEARAQQNNIAGAVTDINVLRNRAHAPLVKSVTKAQLLQIIEDERRYELAFEGHRWYDLVRTGRAATVMSAFSANWTNTYERWPIPQREIQNNPALVGNQNPGY